jgi:hypothetical protein
VRAVQERFPSHLRQRRLLVHEPRPDNRVDQIDTAVKASWAIRERVLPVRMTHDETRAPAALHRRQRVENTAHDKTGLSSPEGFVE